jgi:hypothetical protein
MRLKHVNVRVLLSSLLAVLALSAVVASAAQASAEGPFFKVAGSRLTEGQSKEVTLKSSGSLVMGFGPAGTVTCSGDKFVSGANLTGSTGANFSGGTATIVFTGCSDELGISYCELENGELKTEPLKIQLAYADAGRTGDLYALISPATKGHSFLLLKLKGTGCVPAESAWTGTLETRIVGGKSHEAIQVGAEPAEEKTVGLEFFHPALTEMWLEEKGKLVETRIKPLQYAGQSVDFSGLSSLEAGGSNWGLFT